MLIAALAAGVVFCSDCISIYKAGAVYLAAGIVVGRPVFISCIHQPAVFLHVF